MQADKPHDADKNMTTLKKTCLSVLLDFFSVYFKVSFLIFVLVVVVVRRYLI